MKKRLAAILLMFTMLFTAMPVYALGTAWTFSDKTDCEWNIVFPTQLVAGETYTGKITIVNKGSRTINGYMGFWANFYDKADGGSKGMASVKITCTPSEVQIQPGCTAVISLKLDETGWGDYHYYDDWDHPIKDYSMILAGNPRAKFSFWMDEKLNITRSEYEAYCNAGYSIADHQSSEGCYIWHHASELYEVALIGATDKFGGNQGSHRNGWNQQGGKWYYYSNGKKQTGWKKINGTWYCFESNGCMCANVWKKDSKGWCYLGSDGKMVKNNWAKDSKDWCYLGADGYMVKNCWKKDSKGWCYLGADGRMVTNGWAKDSKGWCYLDADGYMVKNCWQKDSKGWCYLGSDGRMVTNGWAKDSKGWCYLGSDGRITKNKWVKDKGSWYFLKPNGYMAASEWWDGYWLNANGTWTYKPRASWKKNATGWWYGDTSGWYAKNAKYWIDGKQYYFRASGYWTTASIYPTGVADNLRNMMYKDIQKKYKVSGERPHGLHYFVQVTDKIGAHLMTENIDFDNWNYCDPKERVDYVSGQLADVMSGVSGTYTMADLANALTASGGKKPRYGIVSSPGSGYFISYADYIIIAYDSSGDGKYDRCIHVANSTGRGITSSTYVWLANDAETETRLDS